MKTVRFGVFETNSSSTHSLNICTEEEFQKWINGETVYDEYKEEFIKKPDNYDESELDAKTYEDFGDRDYCEGFEKHFTTPSGDKMVAFGYYGYDG